METKKDPMEVLKQEVLASKMLDSYFHQLIKEKGGLSAEDIQELLADYVMKHSTAEELVDELDLEHTSLFRMWQAHDRRVLHRGRSRVLLLRGLPT